MFVTSTTLSQHETETTTVSLWWSFYCNIICSVLSPRTPFSLLTCRSDFSSLPLPPTRSPSSFFFSVSPLRTQICRLKVRLTPGGNWPTCSPSTHFKRREDHSATCTGNPFSFLCARPLLMTPTDSEGCTVLSLWIETRDSFWYQRMNRCADAPPPPRNFNQSSFVVRRCAVLTELFGAKPAWLLHKLPAKLLRVMELSVAWSCTL